jgi:hypothetical protein
MNVFAVNAATLADNRSVAGLLSPRQRTVNIVSVSLDLASICPTWAFAISLAI